MLRRLHALYLRYAAVHADRLSGMPIGPYGRRIGQVERVERLGEEIILSGWADAAHLRLTWRGGEVSGVPDIHRADVFARRGGRSECGFRLIAPVTARGVVLWVELAGGTALQVDIRHPSDDPGPLAHRRMQRAFLRDLVRASPVLLRHVLSPSDRTRTAIKRALRLDGARPTPVLDAGWFQRQAQPHASGPITIILPVHNALDLLRDCLARVEAHTDLPWSLIVVEDASTDLALRPWLIQWAQRRADRVTVLTQDRNLGFVGAVNESLALAQARGGAGPVVLLNSDAMVPAGWASRLTAPLTDASVASVTPMSNAADVLSVPAIGSGMALLAGEGDALDAVARGLGAMPLPLIPTGVGFCMAMSRDWLARVPRLDPAFGRGYGEEVDWCQKTAALGARHLCQPGLFVEHVGGQSFGSAEKAEALRRSAALISQRYPAYDARVQAFIAADPLATPRLALAIALAGLRADPLPVFLAHSLGGGAEVALQRELGASAAAIVLRVGGQMRWRIEVHVGGQITTGQTHDITCLRALLAPVAALRLVYSCGVGDPDPVTLPKSLLSLRRTGKGDVVEMRLHDYFPISPAYTLLGAQAFSGVPSPDTSDPAHVCRRADGSAVPLSQWRAAWGDLVNAAQEVTVFSATSRELFQQAYPNARTRLAPHPMPSHVRRTRNGAADTIGILGHLNRQKGALVLRQIARRNPSVRFILLGLADSAIALPGNVRIHGDYRPEDISDLTEHYGISGWIMPAIWPETFSFATREALATGLPVAGFALGAQGEALEAAPNGTVVALDPQDTMAQRLFDALRTDQARNGTLNAPLRQDAAPPVAGWRGQAYLRRMPVLASKK